MARQASSRIGGIVGIAIGLIVVVAIVATPVYIGVLQNHRSRVGSEVSSKVESIRRTILNLDENLLRLRSYSVDTADEPVTDFEISADAQGSLNATASALQRVEQADAERGTEMADLRVAQGKPQAQSFSQLVSKQDKLLSDARKELMELQQGSSKDLTSARISAVMKYVEGRLEKNRGDYLLWKAEQALDRATEMANTLQGIGGDRDLALKSKPTELVGMIDSKIAETNDTIETKRDELAKLDATIADFNARIETLDQTARSNRLQMADMQARRASIHEENGQYATLAQAAREAERESEALRFGTLKDAEAVITGIDEWADMEYQGGTPTVGLLTLESNANNLRLQIESHTAQLEKLKEQKRYYETTIAGKGAIADQAGTELGSIGEAIDASLANARQLQSDSAVAFDTAVKAFEDAGIKANSAANDARTWKSEITNKEVSEGTTEAQLVNMVRSDGDMEGSMKALAAESQFQAASVRAAQITMAGMHQMLLDRIAKLTGAELENEYGERIQKWRADALSNLDKAQTSYEAASTLLAQSQATLDGKAIRGNDYAWQTKVGIAAVRLLRANLLTELADRRAEKDEAFNNLKEAAEGREQSELLTPAIETIRELQRNPS